MIKSPMSLKISPMLTILVTAYLGPTYGYMFLILSVVLESIAVVEYPQHVPPVFLMRLIFCVLLPARIPFTGENLVYYVLMFLIPKFVLAIPIWAILGKRDPPTYTIMSAINLMWNAWILMTFGYLILPLVSL